MKVESPVGAIGYIKKGKNTVNINIVDEEDRLLKFAYRNAMLEDNFYPQVVTEIDTVITSADETGLIDQIDDTHNLFRLVMEELSQVYDIEPDRVFDVESETNNAEMLELYEKWGVNNILTQANLKVNAFNNILLQVGVSDDNSKFNFRIRTPDKTIVKVDEFNELETVYIYLRDDDKKQIWQAYTIADIYQISVNSANDVLKHTSDNIINTKHNPLSFLPFLVVKNHENDDFWHLYKGDNLVKANIQVAIKMTILNQLIKYQSFKQLVVEASGGNTGTLDNVTIDPASVLYLFGNDAKVSTLDLESNYKMLWDTIREIIGSVATQYKINPAIFKLSSGTQASGYSLQMGNFKLDKAIVKQQLYFKGVEKELFEMLSNINKELSLNLVKGESFSVVFPPIKYPKSDKETKEGVVVDISMCATSTVDEIMKNKGIDREEAEEIYQRNIEYRNQANGVKDVELGDIDLDLGEG